jgi:hypothetical protein
MSSGNLKPRKLPQILILVLKLISKVCHSPKCNIWIEKRKAMLRLLEAKREEIIASFGTLKLMKTENGDVVSSKVLPKIA